MMMRKQYDAMTEVYVEEVQCLLEGLKVAVTRI